MIQRKTAFHILHLKRKYIIIDSLNTCNVSR